VNARLIQDKGLKNRLELTATAYDGSLNVQATGDLPGDLFSLTAQWDRSNLAKLKGDTPLKDKEISGFLSMSADLTGSMQHLKDLRGGGFVFIQDGRLWQLNLLKGLGKFLLIPEFKNIVFTEALGDFIVRNQRIESDNITLKSDFVNLYGSGYIDFQGSLNWDVTSQVNEQSVIESRSVKKAITSILTETGDILEIKIVGTLKEPKYIPLPSSRGVLQKTRDLIKEGLQNVLE
jgi:hypothetical protein